MCSIYRYMYYTPVYSGIKCNNPHEFHEVLVIFMKFHGSVPTEFLHYKKENSVGVRGSLFTSSNVMCAIVLNKIKLLIT